MKMNNNRLTKNFLKIFVSDIQILNYVCLTQVLQTVCCISHTKLSLLQCYVTRIDKQRNFLIPLCKLCGHQHRMQRKCVYCKSSCNMVRWHLRTHSINYFNNYINKLLIFMLVRLPVLKYINYLKPRSFLLSSKKCSN